MAVSGYAESLFGGLEANLKRVLVEFSRYVIPNARFGPPTHQEKSESFQAYFVKSTTASSTEEFSIVHGMGRTPYLAVPMLDIGSSNTKLPVLTVTRAADGQRVYLKADTGSTNAIFMLFLE